MLRTHTCGDLNLSNQGEAVILCGWIQNMREFGKLIFIDLRDRYGITQVVFNQDTNADLANQAKALNREYVLQVNGIVKERENKNPNLATGEIEIIVDALKVLNPSETPPFTIIDDTDGSEELRLKYRYLDLRRPEMTQRVIGRAKLFQIIRNYLDNLNFLEIETPIMIKSTPEGARDFLVPSRLHQGQFYALPQSPQILKQILMVAGMDRYYQLVKCFRDEDFRGDRQPEFTQLDCEMSFITQKDIFDIFGGLVKTVYDKFLGVQVDINTMTYQDAMRLYGSDKPDLRFDARIWELNNVLPTSEFPVFNNAISSGGLVAGIVAHGCAAYSRKQIDQCIDYVKEPNRGLGGMVWIKFDEEGWKSSVDKFYTPEQIQAIGQAMEMKKGDLAFIAADRTSKVQKSLGDLRLKLAKDNQWAKEGDWKITWIVDFPLFEKDEETGETHFVHHPFCMPNPDDIQYLDTDPLKVRGQLYDLVINGNELLSGSMRIYDRTLQNKIFDILGMTEEEKTEKFGFMLEAFKYGAPPHGGCAFGIDRWLMLMMNGQTIRDVIPFPKSSNGKDMMMDAPSSIDETQLEELGLKIVSKK